MNDNFNTNDDLNDVSEMIMVDSLSDQSKASGNALDKNLDKIIQYKLASQQSPFVLEQVNNINEACTSIMEQIDKIYIAETTLEELGIKNVNKKSAQKYNMMLNKLDLLMKGQPTISQAQLVAMLMKK